MKIIVTVGCSGSGKSTWAHNEWKKNPSETIIVNRDKIRELLYGYSESNVNEYYQRKDISKLEKQVTLFEDTLIHDGLNLGKTVIVDATHLKKKYLERFEFFNVPVEFVLFHEDFNTLVDRDSKRNRSVGKDVINKQYNTFKNLKEIPNLSKVKTIINDKHENFCYIVDIDGTVAEKGERSPYDWKRVLEDHPRENIIHLVNELSESAEIIFCSGRDEVCRNETTEWLKYWFPLVNFKLLMRKEGDNRADWIIKEELWESLASEGYYIKALIDDRNQVVRRARSLGLDVLQVQYGNF